MADAKISALPSATVPLAGTEVLPIVQSGVTDQVAAADLLRQNGQTVTTSNPVLSLAQTWNAGAVTFTGILFNATSTASAASSLLMDLQVAGSSIFKVDKTGGVIVSGDTVLLRDAANVWAARNSTNPQTFRVYNTYTDASNHERAGFFWSANTAYVRTEQAGTGTARSLYVGTSGSANLGFQTNNVLRWYIDTSGNYLALTDNAADIGASGANRPRNGFFGTSVYIGSTLFFGSGTTNLNAPSDGVLLMRNGAQTDFTRLQFGGTTSSFPALRRSGTSVEAVLADNSAYTGLNADNIAAAANRAITAGGIAGVGFKLSTTANFGVFFGSGAPTISAAKGSLYLRSDGTTVNDRMYVNSDGSTAWVSVTTSG